MKKMTAWLAIAGMLLLFVGGLTYAGEKDLVGTWIGETGVPDAPEPDKLTIVFAMKDGELTGTFTDTLGFASEAPLEDIKYEDGSLTFHFDVSDGYDTFPIYCTLKVEGDSMTGYWENDGGESSEIKLERKK
jgi:hypothetical protein